MPKYLYFLVFFSPRHGKQALNYQVLCPFTSILDCIKPTLIALESVCFRQKGLDFSWNYKTRVNLFWFKKLPLAYQEGNETDWEVNGFSMDM